MPDEFKKSANKRTQRVSAEDKKKTSKGSFEKMAAKRI